MVLVRSGECRSSVRANNTVAGRARTGTPAEAGRLAHVTKDDWAVGEAWAGLGMHWHGYVERVPLAHAATRDERLGTEPDEVMVNPDEVAAWLEGTIKAATSPAPIKGATLEDTRDFDDSMRVWRSLASR